MIQTLNASQYAMLVTIRNGTPHTLWPMMRRALQARGLIEPAAPPIAPSDTSRRRQPTRPYVLSPAGERLLAESAEVQQPACGQQKMFLEEERMRALTLTQPWAGLVASGLKLIENRPRPFIRRTDFGKRFAIHASREIAPEVYDRIRGVAPELAASFDCDGGWWALTRVTSAVIGVATIDDVLDARAAARSPLPDDQLRWFFGPVGYVLRDVEALATPVPCRGWQGFWTLPDDVARAVVAQIGGMP